MIDGNDDNAIRPLLPENRYGRHDRRPAWPEPSDAIADHLASLVRPPPAEKPELLDEIASSKDSDFGAEAAFENEGGRLGPDLVEDLGITHSVIDQYTVGKYRYTNLDDAIAQAQRLRERPAG